jgi:thymidylate synthase (FAD)
MKTNLAPRLDSCRKYRKTADFFKALSEAKQGINCGSNIEFEANGVVESMEVKLLAFTPEPELVCARAMRACRAKQPAHKLEVPREDVVRLVRNARKLGHLSVLEHASFTFSVAGISRACSHQLVRHRMASYSQQSHRAVAMTQSDVVVPPSVQKSSERFEVFKKSVDDSFNSFNRLLKLGVQLEDARYVLPNALMTNLTVTMNARELLHFFKLRLASSAQWEIRELARRMLQEVKKIAPVMFEQIDNPY